MHKSGSRNRGCISTNGYSKLKTDNKAKKYKLEYRIYRIGLIKINKSRESDRAHNRDKTGSKRIGTYLESRLVVMYIRRLEEYPKKLSSQDKEARSRKSENYVKRARVDTHKVRHNTKCNDRKNIEDQQMNGVCNFFKKQSKNKNIRKRPTIEKDNGNGDSKDETSVIYHKKKPAAADNKLHFSTGSSKQQFETETEGSSKPPLFHFESLKEIQVHNDSRATATLETETEFSRDARAIREKALKQEEEALKEKGSSITDKKVYKGIHGYTDYKAGFRREHTVAGEKAGGAHGPLRASAHIRVSARFDYQPDICKDYKETGYCGYGDACKFMHDRGDYKPGWQLEKEWDEAEKVRKRKLALGVGNDDEDTADKSDEEEDDSLPFACFICREPFVDPVVTKCKHYFCEHCALKHHAKHKKCFVCNQPTLGIFNTAFEIRKRMSAEGKQSA